MIVPPKMTKAQIGALEERLFSGNWSSEDIDLLSSLYQQQNKLAQWGRITDIKNQASIYIYKKRKNLFAKECYIFS